MEPAALLDAQQNEVRDMLDKFAMLHVILKDEEIPLPTIVLVGDQSSGKSSVLESILGVEVPRGQGCVTRCPLRLRMSAYEGDTYATIQTGDNDEVKISDLGCPDNGIGAKITELTNNLAGGESLLSDKPISLTVYRRGAPNLTVIDLPGITRNAVKNQPKDIYKQIHQIISKFIAGKEVIILNVIPADIDFATSESMAMSGEVDPDGVRTMGVITKCDKADKGIGARLIGRDDDSLHLRLGYVGVKNRSQQELDDGVTLQESLVGEAKNFDEHAELKHVPLEYKGTEQLCKKLAQIQMERIKSCIPDVRSKLQTEIANKSKELSEFPPKCEGVGQAIRTLMDVVTDTQHEFQNLSEGRNECADGEKTLHIAARLNEQFIQYREQVHSTQSKFLSPEYAETIREASKEVQGVSLPNIWSHQVIQDLAAAEVDKIEDITLNVVLESSKIVRHVWKALCNPKLRPFPRLQAQFIDALDNLVDDVKQEEIKIVKETLQVNKAVVNTWSHYYMDTVHKIEKEIKCNDRPKKIRKIDPSTYKFSPLTYDLKKKDDEGDEEMEDGEVKSDSETIQTFQINMKAYWETVRQTLIDQVVKGIRYRFVCKLQKRFQDEIFDKFADGNKLVKLIK